MPVSVKLPWDPLVVRSCVLSGRCHTAGTEVSHRSPRRLEYLAFGPSWTCAGPRFRRPVPSAWDRVKHRKARVFLPLLSLRRCPAARRHALSFGACRGAPSSSRKQISPLKTPGFLNSGSPCPRPGARGRLPPGLLGGRPAQRQEACWPLAEALPPARPKPGLLWSPRPSPARRPGRRAVPS